MSRTTTVAPPPPSSPTPASLRLPDAVLPPSLQTHAPAVSPRTIGRQGSQERVPSVESPPVIHETAKERAQGPRSKYTPTPPSMSNPYSLSVKKHKVMVQKSRKKDREQMIKTIYSDRRTKGYSSSLKDLQSLLRYEQHLAGVGSGVSTPSREHHRSSAGSTMAELSDDFVERLFQKAKKSLAGPPNQRPFAPSFEQLQLARKTKEAKDKETQGLFKHSEPSLNPPASAAAAAKLEIPEGTFVLTYEKLESEVVIQSVQDDAAGAIAVFIGTTRDSFQGQVVTCLEYQAYSTMAVKTMTDIFLSAQANATRSEYAASSGPPVSPLLRCVVHHRLGAVPVGEASIVIAVSSPRRKEAFVACEYILEQVTLKVPIWKKEVCESGEPQRKANHPPPI